MIGGLAGGVGDRPRTCFDIPPPAGHTADGRRRSESPRSAGRRSSRARRSALRPPAAKRSTTLPAASIPSPERPRRGRRRTRSRLRSPHPRPTCRPRRPPARAVRWRPAALPPAKRSRRSIRTRRRLRLHRRRPSRPRLGHRRPVHRRRPSCCPSTYIGARSCSSSTTSSAVSPALENCDDRPAIRPARVHGPAHGASPAPVRTRTSWATSATPSHPPRPPAAQRHTEFWRFDLGLDQGHGLGAVLENAEEAVFGPAVSNRAITIRPPPITRVFRVVQSRSSAASSIDLIVR